MKNFISSCNHLDSFLSASTIDKAIDKAASLGNEYVTITDHGYLTGIMKAYKIAEKKKLKIIPGVELYFKDPDCEVAKNSQATNFKYFKIVIHTKDQEAYQELVKLSSYDRTKRTVEINEHLYNLHDWKDLIHLSKYNVTVTTSDVECLVSKYLLINRPDLAERSYLKLKELFKDNFYPSIIPVRNTEYWSQVVEISLSSGQKLKVAPKDRVTIEEESRCTGMSLFNRFRHGKPCTLTGVAINGVVYGIKNKSQLITNVKYKKDFQSIGSDLQLTANKFVIEMATKYNDLNRLLISSYAYYADKEDITIQNMKLSDLRQVKHSQYMQSNEDCLPYLREIFSQNEQKIADLIENTHKWANLFIDFKLKYDYRLPDHGEKPAKDQIIDTIKKVGRMKWDNPQWVKQLREELDILTNNGVKDLCPYFLPLNDLLQANLDNGKLTGPGRGCLVGDTLVYSQDRLIKLKDLKIGDSVFTHDGSSQVILDKFEYDIEEDLLEIRTEFAFGTTKLTRDHKLYGIKRERTESYYKYLKENKPQKLKIWKDIDTSDIVWDQAQNFKVGDLLYTPWILERKIQHFPDIDLLPFAEGKIYSYNDNEIVLRVPKKEDCITIREIERATGLRRLYLSRIKNKKIDFSKIRKSRIQILHDYLHKNNSSLDSWINSDNYRYFTIKRFLKMDSDTCTTIGRWIGDGWISRNKSSGFGIAFHRNEIDRKDHFKKWLENIGIPYSIREHKKKKLTQITSNFDILQKLFKSLFSEYNYTSKTKYIGSFIYLEDDLLRALFVGLMESDGSTSHNRQGYRSSYTSTGFRLISEMKLLLNYLKVPCSILTRQTHKQGKYLCNISYQAHFHSTKAKRVSKEHVITDQGYFSKILSIKTISGIAKVYDISVNNNQNYLSSNFIVHNSAGGFLISYLMGITQIDPIKHGLSSSRFITKDRIQEGSWPDTDCDFEDRDLLVGKDGNSGYLYGKYGKRAAQISTRGQLRLKSSILDVNRYLNGEVEVEIESFAKALPSTPQGISDYDFIYGYKDGDGNIIPGLIETNKDLQKYIDNRKNEWEMVLKCLALTRQFSKHASAYLVSDTDIENTLPIFKVGETDRVTQYEAKEAETVGMVKYDFLVVKNLKDIRLCMDLINKRNKVTKKTGYFQHNNEEVYIWDLPHDKGVYSDLSEGKTETVFQLSTTSVTPFVQKIRPESIEDLAVITALVRPGPLDYIDESTGRNMAEEYIYRRNGLSKSDLPVLEKLLPETYGTLVYQEQVTKIAKEVGLMTVSEAENVRIAMGKKKIQLMNSLKPKFVEGATKTLNSAEDAEKLWSMLATFGRYGFNKSHSVAYVTIAYACAFLKHHYPLEWWSAILSNADDKEINENFYKYVKDILLPPDINISQEEIQIDYINNTLRNKLSVISGMGDKAVGKIILNRPYKDIVDFVRKGVCGRALAEKLIFTRVLDSLFDPKDVLIDKLQKHANAIELVEHDKKIEKYKEKLAFETDLKKKARIEKTLNKLLTSNPEAGTINPAYFGLTGIAVAKIQKTVIPTMRIDFNSLILKESKKVFHLPSNPPRIGVRGVRGEYQLIEPSFLEKIDAKTLTLSLTQQLSKTESKSFYFACAGYVLDVSEFSYQKNTKKALKILIDFSGFITEKVIWPDRETGELNRPKDLVKGSVATFIMYKQAEKKYTNILDIVIE